MDDCMSKRYNYAHKATRPPLGLTVTHGTPPLLGWTNIQPIVGWKANNLLHSDSHRHREHTSFIVADQHKNDSIENANISRLLSSSRYNIVLILNQYLVYNKICTLIKERFLKFLLYCVFIFAATHVSHPRCPPQSGYVRGFNHACGCICVPVPG